MSSTRGRTDEGVDRLLAVTRSITGELDLDRLLRVILVSAVEVTGAERGCFMTSERPDGAFDRVLHHQMEPEELESEEFRPSRTSIEQVRTTRRGLRLSDARSLPNPSQSVEIHNLRSILVEPLVLRDELVGLIYLDSSKISNLFTPRHQDLLSSFAAQAAICLDNARLFRQVQEANRRQLEEELRAREMEARRDLMSAFISIAAHDIKNPLSVLRGGTYVLKRLQVPPPGPQVLESMDQSIEQAIRLVQNYLEFARLDTSEPVALDLQQVDLLPLVQREVALLRTRLPVEGFAIEVDVPQGLALRADASRLEQILANLLDNAAKYSPGGGRIRLRATPRMLEVSDTGVGIPKEEQARLFERFSRLEATSGQAKGTGLGLWITRRLAELHGWTIELESTPGEGSTFRIRLQ